MELWTAFLLGLVGSVHCAGMCGPLALALPVVGSRGWGFVWGRIIYNAGRVGAYITLGMVFGLAGKGLALSGFQRWLSISAGVLMLAGLILGTGKFKMPVVRWVGFLKSRFGSLLKKRTYLSLLALGAINGFLPCGLVYLAATAGLASGDFWMSTGYMAAFGLGTWPVMLGMGLLGKRFQLRFRFQRLIPLSVVIVAMLLIVRGLSLGIPYLSPNISGGAVQSASCH
jgi:sulfite exporter TauE/SafE